MKPNNFNLRYFSDNAGTHYEEYELLQDAMTERVKTLMDDGVKLEDIQVWRVSRVEISVNLSVGGDNE